jgi:hypothetical protein
MKTIICLLAFLVIAPAVFAEGGLDDKYSELKNALNKEQFSVAEDDASYILKHLEQTNENLEQYGRVSFMMLFALAGEVANGSKKTDDIKPIVEKVKGGFVVLPIVKFVLGSSPRGRGFLNVDPEKLNNLYLPLNNRNGTSILCSCFANIANNYNPSELEGKYVLIGGLLKDIEYSKDTIWILRIIIDPAEIHEY